MLSDAQKERICSFGWKKFLEMKVNAVESRELFLWLLERIDTDSMKLKVNPNFILPLNKSALETVLGVVLGLCHVNHRRTLPMTKRNLLILSGAIRRR